MADLFRFGIEEEFFLADARTGHSPDAPVAARFHAAVDDAMDCASRELLVGQIEVQTDPLASLDEAHARLRALRRDLAAIAGGSGLSLLAAGTHPLAMEPDQHITEQRRYEHLAGKVGVAMAERVMVCAMHVHVELPEPDARIGVMNRLVPFLPLLLALSVSSPFWEGRDTGIKGFRLAAFAEWPHMGLPVRFEGKADYERFIETLVAAGVIPDASFVWWVMRPAARYPTIELRVCDSCTRADDAVAIAALFRCLVRAAWRRPDLNGDVGPVDWGVTSENIWQVQRHGRRARLIDVRRGGSFSVADTLEATLGLVTEDAAALAAAPWLERCRAIVAEGTSAERQLAAFHEAEGRGLSGEDALRPVVEAVAAETLA